MIDDHRKQPRYKQRTRFPPLFTMSSHSSPSSYGLLTALDLCPLVARHRSWSHPSRLTVSDGDVAESLRGSTLIPSGDDSIPPSEFEDGLQPTALRALLRPYWVGKTVYSLQSAGRADAWRPMVPVSNSTSLLPNRVREEFQVQLLSSHPKSEIKCSPPHPTKTPTRPRPRHVPVHARVAQVEAQVPPVVQ
jgi:hypothetical protein